MFEITAPVPVATSGSGPDANTTGRRRPIVLTNRHCEKKRVDRRIKLYDRKCAGLYVSITTSGVATFYGQIKGRCKWLGAYNPTTFNVDDARAAVYALRSRIGAGENVFETLRQHKALKAKQGLTVDELIELRIAWMKALEKKVDGEKRPRIETWGNVASHLRRLVSPKLGKRIAAELSRSDIAALSNDIIDGKFGVASVSNARHMRRAVSGLYNWAAEAGRDYVPATCRPCLKLPKLPKEHPRDRVLTADEIRIFWHGLDRDDMPWDRRTRLALKFALVSMLRSGELLPAHRDELFDLDGANARFDVPLKRVKKRRVIQQPLSNLAVEIIKEALECDEQDYIFAGRFGDAPLERKAMATVLRGTRNKDGTIRTRGICDILGLKPFTPHDLRRTAATLAGDLGFSDAWIAKCLDHSASKDEHGARVPSVTGRVYNHSKRLQQKRAVLNGVAAALREIVGEPVKQARTEMRVAA
jgi:integrase